MCDYNYDILSVSGLVVDDYPLPLFLFSITLIIFQLFPLHHILYSFLFHITLLLYQFTELVKLSRISFLPRQVSKLGAGVCLWDLVKSGLTLDHLSFGY
jgi:hypothetical protein